MTEIDLHGFKHEEVKEKLANLLILHYNVGNLPIRVITGNSDKMKQIVKQVCEKYEFTIDNSWNNNPGTIIIRS